MPAHPANDRHERGRRYLAKVAQWWIKQSQLSQRSLGAISAWGLGEACWLDNSQISRVSNGKLERNASVKLLDALCAANKAIHSWQVLGPEKSQELLGPYHVWGVRSEWLDACIWLAQPGDPDQPLTYGDWAELNVGYLSLPYLPALVLTRNESRSLSEELCDLLNELAPAGPPAKAVAAVIEAYPVQDKKRVERLRSLLLGDESWNDEELQAEMFNLAALVSHLRQQECAPGDLLEELRERRRQSG